MTIAPYTADELVAFEEEMATLFNAGKIRHPVHLDNGNEVQTINIYKDIHKGDWLCGSWRQHIKCLLHGVPRDELKAAILRGESMALCFPEYRVVSSAII